MTVFLPLDDAALIARMHAELWPDHHVTIVPCDHRMPVAFLCETCTVILAAVKCENHDQ